MIISFITSRGRTIPVHVIQTIVDRINRGDDCQTIITDEVREWIPEYADDIDEAMEVYNHCESVIADARIDELFAN